MIEHSELHLDVKYCKCDLICFGLLMLCGHVDVERERWTFTGRPLCPILTLEDCRYFSLQG